MITNYRTPPGWLAMFVAAVVLCSQCAGSGLDTSGWRASHDSVRLTQTGQQAHPSVCRISAVTSTGRCMGSGVYVGDGYVLTCYHTFRKRPKTIGVGFATPPPEAVKGWIQHCTLAAVDKTWDLATLKLPCDPRVSPARLAPTVRLGETLTIAGYGPDARFRALSGTARQYIEAAGGATGGEMVEISCVARGGDSGGPVFNSRGEVAAILWGADHATTGATYGPRLTRFLRQAGWFDGIRGSNQQGRQVWPSPSGGCADGSCNLSPAPAWQGGTQVQGPYQTVPGQPEVIIPPTPSQSTSSTAPAQQLAAYTLVLRDPSTGLEIPADTLGQRGLQAGQRVTVEVYVQDLRSSVGAGGGVYCAWADLVANAPLTFAPSSLRVGPDFPEARSGRAQGSTVEEAGGRGSTGNYRPTGAAPQLLFSVAATVEQLGNTAGQIRVEPADDELHDTILYGGGGVSVGARYATTRVLVTTPTTAPLPTTPPLQPTSPVVSVAVPPTPGVAPTQQAEIAVAEGGQATANWGPILAVLQGHEANFKALADWLPTLIVSLITAIIGGLIGVPFVGPLVGKLISPLVKKWIDQGIDSWFDKEADPNHTASDRAAMRREEMRLEARAHHANGGQQPTGEQGLLGQIMGLMAQALNSTPPQQPAGGQS